MPTYHDVFISYSTTEAEVMKQVRSVLEEHRIRVWTDVEKMEPGEDWQKIICNALDNVGCVLLIASPASNGSQWVKRELEYAHEVKVPILVLWIDGTRRSAIPFNVIEDQLIDARANTLESGIRKLTQAIFQRFRWQLLYRHLRDAAHLLPQPSQARSAIFRMDPESRRLYIYATFGVFMFFEWNLHFREGQGVVGDVWQWKKANIAALDGLSEDELRAYLDMNSDLIESTKHLKTVIGVPILSYVNQTEIIGVLAIDSPRSMSSMVISNAQKHIIENAVVISDRISRLVALETHLHPDSEG